MTEMNKKVYILLATYNGGKYLEEQLKSLLNQSYQNWILWIHDDNSTDNTVEIIDKYSNQFSKKIIYLKDNIASGGAKENFSYLLNSIDNDYDYITFCDQDDVWMKNKIELFVNKMIEFENLYPDIPLVVFSDLKVVDENLETIHQSMMKNRKLDPSTSNNFQSLKLRNVITGCAMMLNKRAVMVSTPVPENVIMHDWWIALCTSKFGKNVYLNTQTILYRQHSENVIGFKELKKLDPARFFRKIISNELMTEYSNLKSMAKNLDENISFSEFIRYKINIHIENLRSSL